MRRDAKEVRHINQALAKRQHSTAEAVGTLVLNAAFGDERDREYAATCLVSGAALVGVIALVSYFASQN